MQCRTWNEAEMAVQRMPDMDHLRFFADRWFEVKERGGVLIVEKGRRILISWFSRCLELHQMGLSRKDWLIGGDDYEAASKHCWRYQHLYEDLQKQGWKLKDCDILRFQGPRKLKTFSLSNGSSCSIVNGESGSVQGDGIFGITFEEFSLYRYPGAMIGQAKIITQGSATSKGGFVVCIANPEANAEWKFIKNGGRF